MNSIVVHKGQSMPLNMFSVIVGPPTTSKSAAMSECCMNPFLTITNDNDMGNFLLERSTTSGLVKCICEQKKHSLRHQKFTISLINCRKTMKRMPQVRFSCFVNFSRANVRRIVTRRNAQEKFQQICYSVCLVLPKCHYL